MTTEKLRHGTQYAQEDVSYTPPGIDPTKGNKELVDHYASNSTEPVSQGYLEFDDGRGGGGYRQTGGHPAMGWPRAAAFAADAAEPYTDQVVERRDDATTRRRATGDPCP